MTKVRLKLMRFGNDYDLALSLIRRTDTTGTASLPSALMDPATIAAVLKGLFASLQWALGAIDEVKQAEAAEEDALKKLKTTMGATGYDVSTFKKLISAMQSPENERLYDIFIQKCAAALHFCIERY